MRSNLHDALTPQRLVLPVPTIPNNIHPVLGKKGSTLLMVLTRMDRWFRGAMVLFVFLRVKSDVGIFTPVHVVPCSVMIDPGIYCPIEA
jgi:hypothetical protein